jgi:hypothetical protein
VLLQIVPFAGDVGYDFLPVRQPHLRHFAERRVRLLGVRVMTWVHTPRRCGQFFRAGDFDFTEIFFRPLRMS